MAKPFDATLNTLLDAHEGEWAAFLAARVGVPLGPVESLDTDLSTTLQADRLFRIDGPGPVVLHLELESSGRLGIPFMVWSLLNTTTGGSAVRSNFVAGPAFVAVPWVYVRDRTALHRDEYLDSTDTTPRPLSSFSSSGRVGPAAARSGSRPRSPPASPAGR